MSKKGLLVVSFGTSHMDAREKQIEPIVQKLQAEFQDYFLYEAYTSQMILSILKKEHNFDLFNLEEAFEQMIIDGITDLIVQPTHVIPGIENDNMLEAVENYKSKFRTIRVGNPLLYATRDYEYVADSLGKYFSDNGYLNDQAVVLMGHGTSHYTNSSYCALEYMFRSRGYEQVFIATVEAFPDLDQVIIQLKQENYKNISLFPFMIVAGDHAKNDMAGEGNDSFQSILQMEGYHVTSFLKGLGEYDAIQDLFVAHANAAKEMV